MPKDFLIQGMKSEHLMDATAAILLETDLIVSDYRSQEDRAGFCAR